MNTGDATVSCIGCGYDLRALPERAACPEFGLADAVARSASGWDLSLRSRWRKFAATVLLIVGLALLAMLTIDATAHFGSDSIHNSPLRRGWTALATMPLAWGGWDAPYISAAPYTGIAGLLYAALCAWSHPGPAHLARGWRTWLVRLAPIPSLLLISALPCVPFRLVREIWTALPIASLGLIAAIAIVSTNIRAYDIAGWPREPKVLGRVARDCRDHRRVLVYMGPALRPRLDRRPALLLQSGTSRRAALHRVRLRLAYHRHALSHLARALLLAIDVSIASSPVAAAHRVNPGDPASAVLVCNARHLRRVSGL